MGKERKWNPIKCSDQTRNGRKRSNDYKNKKKGAGKTKKETTHATHAKQKTITNMVHVNAPLSTIPLNVNGLNTPIKRQGLLEWV